MKKNHVLKFFCIVFIASFAFTAAAQQDVVTYHQSSRNCDIIYFSDTISSFYPTSVFYDFGDGNTSSNTFPAHTYATNGTYTVIFCAKDSINNKRFDDTLTVTINCAPCYKFKNRPIFTAVEDSADCFNIHFRNNAAPSTLTYHWNFGDGSTETLANPTHKFIKKGPHTVTLIVADSNCSDTQTRVLDNFQYFRCPSLCDSFSVGIQQIKDSIDCKKFHFNTIAPASASQFVWTFGDSNTSTFKNPTHTYTNEGAFRVTLTASDSICTSTKSVTVYPYCPGPCDSFFHTFRAQTDSLDCKKLNFTSFSYSLTKPASNYVWNFGDGGSSTLSNPSHTYTQTGRYLVTLLTSDSTCSDSMTDWVYVYCLTPCDSFYANISISADTSTKSSAVLYNRSIGTIHSHSWDFGDGITSNLAAPKHTYTSSGTYTIVYTANDTINNCISSDSVTITIDSLGNLRRGKVAFTINVVDQTKNATSLKDLSASESGLTVYPNPTKQELNIDNILDTDVAYVIYNLQGQEVLQGNIEKGKTEQLNIGNWTSGMYILVSDAGQVIRIKKN